MLEYPIMALAEIMQTKGKLDSAAIFAAMAVLPDAAGSCNKTLIKGVFSEVQTLSEIGEKCEKQYLHLDKTKVIDTLCFQSHPVQ